MTVDHPDLFRAAKMVVDQHGEEAWMFAARRADFLLEDGDLRAPRYGAASWRRSKSCSEEGGG